MTQAVRKLGALSGSGVRMRRLFCCFIHVRIAIRSLSPSRRKRAARSALRAAAVERGVTHAVRFARSGATGVAAVFFCSALPQGRSSEQRRVSSQLPRTPRALGDSRRCEPFVTVILAGRRNHLPHPRCCCRHHYRETVRHRIHPLKASRLLV